MATTVPVEATITTTATSVVPHDNISHTESTSGPTYARYEQQYHEMPSPVVELGGKPAHIEAAELEGKPTLIKVAELEEKPTVVKAAQNS